MRVSINREDGDEWDMEDSYKVEKKVTIKVDIEDAGKTRELIEVVVENTERGYEVSNVWKVDNNE